MQFKFKRYEIYDDEINKMYNINLCKTSVYVLFFNL